MNRVVLYVESEDLGYIFKEYSKFYIRDMVKHTKKYFTETGHFYVTKFNPDALLYEEAILQLNNPFIHQATKDQLLDALEVLSGLNVKYSIVKNNDEIIGIVFDPIPEETVAEVMRIVA